MASPMGFEPNLNGSNEGKPQSFATLIKHAKSNSLKVKKPGCEVKRNRANRKEIHQMNVSINGNGLERIRRRPPKSAGNTARTSFHGAWVQRGFEYV